MIHDFYHQQPHPETNETACTWLSHDAVPLEALDDRSAIACAGAFYRGKFVIAVTFSENSSDIEWLTGDNIRSFSHRSILTIKKPVKQVSLSVVHDTLYLGVYTEGMLYLFKGFEGDFIAEIPTNAESAAVCHVQNEWFFIEDGILSKLDENWHAKEQSKIIAMNTSLDRYPLERKDALELESRDSPGTLGGMLFSYQNSVYYACADVFFRCAASHTDTFLCRASTWNGLYSRRYLVIPCGGPACFFADCQENLYAVFIGQEDSVVRGRAAIFPLLFSEEYSLLSPPRELIMEKTITAGMLPIAVEQHIRDSFVYACPDGWYYLTGTTKNSGSYWKGTSAIRLWRTKDFSDFEKLGIVYDYSLYDNAWQKQISPIHNAWAPEIIFYNGTFWITYSTAPGCGLLKSVSGKPEGPYQDMGRVVMHGIDSGFFMDGEQLYLVWQNGMIAPFNQDCTSFKEEPRLLLPQDGQEVGYEGAGIIRVERKYVLYAAEWNGDLRIDGTYDMMYSTADHLIGPYSPRRVLVPHGGHGSLFWSREGQLRFSMFGNDRTAAFRHSVGIGNIKISYNEIGELILTPDDASITD